MNKQPAIQTQEQTPVEGYRHTEHKLEHSSTRPELQSSNASCAPPHIAVLPAPPTIAGTVIKEHSGGRVCAASQPQRNLHCLPVWLAHHRPPVVDQAPLCCRLHDILEADNPVKAALQPQQGQAALRVPPVSIGEDILADGDRIQDPLQLDIPLQQRKEIEENSRRPCTAALTSYINNLVTSTQSIQTGT